MSNYTKKLIVIVANAVATTANKNAWGALFADNGSGEMLADEALAFDKAALLSNSGSEPATHRGLETPMTEAMYAAFAADSLAGVVNWYALDAATGLLLATDSPRPTIGQPFDFEAAMADVTPVLQRVVTPV